MTDGSEQAIARHFEAIGQDEVRAAEIYVAEPWDAPEYRARRAEPLDAG